MRRLGQQCPLTVCPLGAIADRYEFELCAACAHELVVCFSASGTRCVCVSALCVFCVCRVSVSGTEVGGAAGE